MGRNTIYKDILTKKQIKKVLELSTLELFLYLDYTNKYNRYQQKIENKMTKFINWKIENKKEQRQ